VWADYDEVEMGHVRDALSRADGREHQETR
jgi:hypothetical protein